MPEQWRWTRDTPVDRARRVARSYRALAYELDPERCARLDAEMLKRQQRWVVPQVAVYQPDDLLTADLVADWASVTVRAVYQWRKQGLPSVTTVDGIRFRYGSVVRWLAERRA